MGWYEEESKVVEQPPVKTTERWQITVGGPGWLAWVSGTTGLQTPILVSESAKFSGILTLFIRSAVKLEEGDLVS
jgi:hypothetical protein